MWGILKKFKKYFQSYNFYFKYLFDLDAILLIIFIGTCCYIYFIDEAIRSLLREYLHFIWFDFLHAKNHIDPSLFVYWDAILMLQTFSFVFSSITTFSLGLVSGSRKAVLKFMVGTVDPLLSVALAAEILVLGLAGISSSWNFIIQIDLTYYAFVCSCITMATMVTNRNSAYLYKQRFGDNHYDYDCDDE